MNNDALEQIRSLEERISRLEGAIGISTIQHTLDLHAGQDSSVSINAVGIEADIDLGLVPKGNGTVTVTSLDLIGTDDYSLGGFTNSEDL